MTDRDFAARIDESTRDTGNGLLCVVGAAVVLRSDEDEARRALQDLRLPGQRVLHWRTESTDRRRALLDAVVELGFVAFVAVSHPVPPRGQERARARNLKRLGHVLSRREGIAEVVIESRSIHLDRRDAVTFQEARRHGTVDSAFHYEHAKKGEDPLLWAADIVTSAQAFDLTAAASPYWEPLSQIVLGIERVDP